MKKTILKNLKIQNIYIFNHLTFLLIIVNLGIFPTPKILTPVKFRPFYYLHLILHGVSSDKCH